MISQELFILANFPDTPPRRDSRTSMSASPLIPDRTLKVLENRCSTIGSLKDFAYTIIQEFYTYIMQTIAAFGDIYASAGVLFGGNVLIEKKPGVLE